MLKFFAQLYEWFGLIPFYSRNLGRHLSGLDVTCSGNFGSTKYIYVGVIMIAVILAAYLLQYHIINSPKYSQKHHWWITALILFALNFLIAFTLPFNDLQTANFCKEAIFTVLDCLGFAFSNALWSFILFLILTSLPFPRAFAGHNTTQTTFWKP